MTKTAIFARFIYFGKIVNMFWIFPNFSHFVTTSHSDATQIRIVLVDFKHFPWVLTTTEIPYFVPSLGYLPRLQFYENFVFQTGKNPWRRGEIGARVQ